MSAGGRQGAAFAQSEEQLIRAAQGGDRLAIAELVNRSHERVQRFAHMLCASQEDAEEAAQEALIVLYRKVGTLRAASALASWLFRVVRNECIRRSRIAVRVHRRLCDSAPSAEDVVLERIELRRVVGTIAQLAPDHRAVLLMRDVQGMSGAATAEALGVSRTAMKSRLHRAREAFHADLGAG